MSSKYATNLIQRLVHCDKTGSEVDLVVKGVGGRWTWQVVMVAGGKRKLEQSRRAEATSTPERRFNVMHPLEEVIARKINRSLN